MEKSCENWTLHYHHDATMTWPIVIGWWATAKMRYGFSMQSIRFGDKYHKWIVKRGNMSVGQRLNSQFQHLFQEEKNNCCWIQMRRMPSGFLHIFEWVAHMLQILRIRTSGMKRLLPICCHSLHSIHNTAYNTMHVSIRDNILLVLSALSLYLLSCSSAAHVLSSSSALSPRHDTFWCFWFCHFSCAGDFISRTRFNFSFFWPFYCQKWVRMRTKLSACALCVVRMLISLVYRTVSNFFGQSFVRFPFLIFLRCFFFHSPQCQFISWHLTKTHCPIQLERRVCVRVCVEKATKNQATDADVLFAQ